MGWGEVVAVGVVRRLQWCVLLIWRWLMCGMAILGVTGLGVAGLGVAGLGVAGLGATGSRRCD